MNNIVLPTPWTFEGMSERREWIFAKVRKAVRKFVNEDGSWKRISETRNDPRGYFQVSLPLLRGNDADQQFARKLLNNETVQQRINNCSFCTEYLLAVIYGMGSDMPEDLLVNFKERISNGLLRYAKKDLQHHGYNDNHVTLATSSLVLGGQLTGNQEAIEEGRANLLNFRDTFLRRGFMHETNDCYIPHTLYSTAIVGQFAEDDEIRQLAKNCEARIWIDWIGHYHPNLARKPGPSARDYTMGRLNPLAVNTALWCIFGDDFKSPIFPPEDVFADQQNEERYFSHYQFGDMFWNMGLLSRVCAHGYQVPENVAPLIYDRDYPHKICGTHEVGNFVEGARREIPGPGGTKALESITVPEVVPFSAREIYTYQYQETDWAMGTASQRMIGGCPNNNWCVNYRKRPLQRSSDQGLIYCSFTINDKMVTGENKFQVIDDDPSVTSKEDMVHWFDSGRYAAMQHRGTAIMLYRPRILDKSHISSLATSLVFPLCFDNHIDQIWLDDKELIDFSESSQEVKNIFIQDGPMFIGFRPLLSRPQSCEFRIKALKEDVWGIINIYAYQGEEVALNEMDLCRIGGGFICEVATKNEFADIDAFRNWFNQAQVLDEQKFWMRQVRYHRQGLDMGIRYDVWADNIMYRMLNGREMPMPKFACSGVDEEKLPWLTGDVSDLDHFSWSVRQAKRDLADHCKEPGRITDEAVI